jgi:hypothetical protein
LVALDYRIDLLVLQFVVVVGVVAAVVLDN